MLENTSGFSKKETQEKYLFENIHFKENSTTIEFIDKNKKRRFTLEWILSFYFNELTNE